MCVNIWLALVSRLAINYKTPNINTPSSIFWSNKNNRDTLLNYIVSIPTTGSPISAHLIRHILAHAHHRYAQFRSDQQRKQVMKSCIPYE